MFATEKNGKPNTMTNVPTIMVGRTIESSGEIREKNCRLKMVEKIGANFEYSSHLIRFPRQIQVRMN